MSNSTIKSLNFVESSGRALQAAKNLIVKLASGKEAAEIHIDPLADRLLKEFHLVEAYEVPQLRAKLASHEETLKVLNGVLTEYGRFKVAAKQRLAVAQGGGELVDDAVTKVASASNPNTGFRVLGQRSGTGEKRASDASLRQLAGLPV